jgi:hypothetical protein
MRFASLQSSGGAAEYARAGKAVADSAARVFDVQRKTGPDYAGISKVAMKTASQEKIAGMKAQASVAKAGINAVADMKQAQIKTEVFNKGEEIKNKQRKAGGIAAIGKIAGAGFLAATDNTKGRERPKADLGGLYEGWKGKHDALKARQQGESDALGSFTTPEFKSSEGTPGKVTEGGTNNASQGLSGTGLSGDGFDMSKLTTKDFDDLAFAISSEAQLGTDDEYGVGANILTRLQSGNYGSSVNAIINAPGQYEGVYTGRSVASPEISARLQSPEGRKKLQEAMQRLDGRTEFKGQTMLHNRVAAEDPMFSAGGNFYHHAGQ